MVGHNEHHIKNSADFVKKIEGLQVPPPYTLVSYDVKALFTSIATQKALPVICRRLQEDGTFKDRCELSVDQVVMLLGVFLNTTYFVYNGQFYQQKKGAAMGTPVSPLVANLYMEDFRGPGASHCAGPS